MPDRWIDDHIGDETSPRPGFEDELGRALTAAWRTDGDGGPKRVAVGRPTARRGRSMLIAGLGTAAAVIAVLTAIAITPDSGTAPSPADPVLTTPAPIPTAAPTTTSLTAAPPSTPTTTVPTASTEATTPSTTPTTPTTAPAWVPTDSIPTDSPEGFFPACTERAGARAQNDLTAPPTFGPLQLEPTLTVWLPAGVDPADYPARQRITSPKTTATVVPGGVLVLLNQANGDSSSLLAAVNFDGSIRWVRCTSGDQRVSPYNVIAATGQRSEAFVLLTDAGSLGAPVPNWVELDLATGEFGPTLAERLAERNPSLNRTNALTLVGQNRAHLLLASDRMLSGQDDVLLLVNRETLVAERLPDAGASADNLQTPSLDGLGRPVLSVGSPSGPQLVAVYDGGAWVADVRSLAPPTVRISSDPDTGYGSPAVVDGAGDTMWQRTDLIAWIGEGFQAAVVGDVTITRVCTDAPACGRWAVVGLRTSDGEQLWQLDAPAAGGVWNVGPIGDGLALLQEPTTLNADGTAAGGAWIMVETSTGWPVEGQRWEDPMTFEAQCCGGGEFVHVTRDGGAVIAVNERRISIWFPAGTDLTPATAILP